MSLFSPSASKIVLRFDRELFSKPDPDLGDHNSKICGFEISFELIQGNNLLENRHQLTDSKRTFSSVEKSFLKIRELMTIL